MIPVIIIAVCVSLALITVVLTTPNIRIGKLRFRVIYWYVPLLGAVVLLCGRFLTLGEAWKGLTVAGSINPLKILVLFISMTTLSIFLDEAGMFRFLAGKAMAYAGTDQKKLFLILYLLVSVLTVFTSNDIIILTFTPFICYFSANAKIDPVPYLFGEFVAANTWSMALIIGNPTNIYLASAAGIAFGEYVIRMLLPTVFAGLCAYGLLRLLFRKQLAKPMSQGPAGSGIEDPVLVIIGVIHLGICTVLLVISSYIGLEMWYITLGFACSLFLSVGIYRLFFDKKKVRKNAHIVLHTLKRAPWELIPFVLSMFLIVLALEKNGVTGLIAQVLSGASAIDGAAQQSAAQIAEQSVVQAATQSGLLQTGETVLLYGSTSFLCANLMNNIPMAVLYGSITGQLTGGVLMPAVYASVIGSNLGAFFTPLGALAGIMWASILKRIGIDFSFKKYVSYGVRISIPTLIAALAGLFLSFLAFV